MLGRETAWAKGGDLKVHSKAEDLQPQPRVCECGGAAHEAGQGDRGRVDNHEPPPAALDDGLMPLCLLPARSAYGRTVSESTEDWDSWVRRPPRQSRDGGLQPPLQGPFESR